MNYSIRQSKKQIITIEFHRSKKCGVCIRATNKFLAHMLQGSSVLTKEGLAADRNSMPKTSVTPPPFVKYIKGPAGNLALRIFKPDTIRAVVMSIHGGGWSMGTTASDDIFNDYIARTCKAAVVSVDYRLAPECPFPACIDDCKAAQNGW